MSCSHSYHLFPHCGEERAEGTFPPSGFFWKPLRCSWWYPMERRTQQLEGSNDSFQDLCPSVPKSVESMCWSIPSIGVLGSFTTLGFWGGLGYSRKEKVTYREESKREQEVYSLLQTYARFSQHAIWFELLLRWKKGSQEKTREELQLLGPLNVTFLNGKTSSPTAHKTHLPLTLKS